MDEQPIQVPAENVTSISNLESPAPSADSNKTEKFANQEFIPSSKNSNDDNDDDQKQDDTTTPNQGISSQRPVVNDKSEEPLQLHQIKKTSDKLTSLADLEEEEFIKEVEAAHDNKE